MTTERTQGRYMHLLACVVLLLIESVASMATLQGQEAKTTPGEQVSWVDCRDLLVEGKGWTDTESFYDRLPARAKGKVPEGVWTQSRQSAGLCVRFTTDAEWVRVRWSLQNEKLALPHMPTTGASGIDLYVQDEPGKWRFVGCRWPTAPVSTSAFKLPPGMQYRLHLPLYNGVDSVQMGVPAGRTLAKPAPALLKPDKPLVFYGTSITQGGCVSRPGMACTSIVGRRLDMPVINLGFASNGRMEPELADLLAELDPSIYILDCLWNMSAEEVAQRVESFVKRLRTAHPNTPILLAEDSNFKNISPTEKGRILREIYAKLIQEGVQKLYFLDNQGMLGEDWEGTIDGCHPDDLGMMRQAEVFVGKLRDILAATKQTMVLPPYPRVNLATWYEVDPAWPQRRAGVQWEAVPGVAVDRNDNVWVFARTKPPVQMYDPAGRLVRAWGDNLVGAAHGLRVDHDGNVWLTDTQNHVVMQLTPEGELLKTLGTRGVPGSDNTHFDKPTDMAISPAGDVFVSDGYGNSRIVHFDRDGKFVKAWGKLGVGPGEFSIPHAIVRDSKGRLYVADRNNVRIQVFDESGAFLSEWRNLLVPWGLCITEEDEIWACGSSPMTWIDGPKPLGAPPKDQVVMRFDPSGKLLALWAIPKGEDDRERPGEVNWAHGIGLDSHGNLYVGDIAGRRIQKFVRHDGAPDQAELKRQRKEAAHRRRRIIMNNDGNDVYRLSDEPRTRENFLSKRTTALAGTQVDAIFYCSGVFNSYHHHSTESEVRKHSDRGGLDWAWELGNNGSDSLATVVDFGHKNKMEVFWSMRMNDTHDAGDPALLCQWKRDHPEYLMGKEENRRQFVAGGTRWSSVNYELPEVRDKVFHILRDVATRYDIDGLELDFYRHPVYFKPQMLGQPVTQQQRGLMTELLRRVRTMADETAAKRGRAMLIAVRVPDSVEYCSAIGLDLVRWMKEDLIDLMAVSCYFQLNPWKTSVDLGHAYGVPVYPCLSDPRFKEPESLQLRTSHECYRGRALDAWNAGADGIYMFNLFDPHSTLWRELGDREKLATMDQVYPSGIMSISSINWVADGRKWLNTVVPLPEDPRKLAAGEQTTIEIPVGAAIVAKPGLAARVKARIMSDDVAKAKPVVAKLNGRRLPEGVPGGKWLEYSVEPSLVQQGVNRLELAMPSAGGNVSVSDAVIEVRYVPATGQGR